MHTKTLLHRLYFEQRYSNNILRLNDLVHDVPSQELCGDFLVVDNACLCLAECYNAHVVILHSP